MTGTSTYVDDDQPMPSVELARALAVKRPPTPVFITTGFAPPPRRAKKEIQKK